MANKPGDGGTVLPKGKGRPKGAKNKIPTDLKEAYLRAFDKRGGVKGLLAWAEKSPDAFYAQISKMLPKEIDNKLTDDEGKDVLRHFLEGVMGKTRGLPNRSQKKIR